QKWHEENNAKHKYNQVNNNQQTAIIDQLKEENYKLKQLFRTAETRTTEQEKRAFEQEKRATEQEMRATEQEKRATEQEERADNLEITLERAVDEAKNQIQAERVSALAEIDELKKNVSEKESILKKTIDQHKEENHRLEQLVRTAETRAKEQEKRAVELEKCLTEQEQRATDQEMRATEQEKRAANLEITLERELDKAKKQIQVVRVSALAEMEELKKNLKEENNKLKHFFRTAEIRATDQEKRAANLEITLERAVDETKNQIQAERAEMEKLKKKVSEKESILKNIIDQLKEKNYKLEKLVHTAENQAKQQEKLATEQEKRAFEQEERADNLEITHERALAEMDELKKNVSEKESILKNTIDQQKEENHRLEQLVRTAETRVKEQEKRIVELKKCLTEQEKHIVEQEMRTTEQEKRAANLEITLERALTEMDELKKNVSEKESILKNITDQLKEENHRLEQLEKRATEQEKRAANLESALVKHVNQNLEERGSALAELDKLKKDASDKESIRKNMAQRIERLELEKQELVIAKQKQLDT
ncbi:AAEL005073-PA, partial [Aedes aegypti]